MQGCWLSWYVYKDTEGWFTPAHLQSLAEAGVDFVILALDKADWRKNLNVASVNIPYRDYIARLVKLGSDLGIRMAVGLHFDTDLYNAFGGYFRPMEKTRMILDDTLRAAWLQWGQDVLTHCRAKEGVYPWGIHIIDEAGGYYQDYPMTREFYRDSFVIPSLQAYRAIDADIAIILAGGGGTPTSKWGTGDRRNLDFFIANPLPYSNVYYLAIAEYRPYAQGSAYAADMAQSRDYAKTRLYAWLEARFNGLLPNVIGAVATETQQPYWREFLQDLYNWYKSKNASYCQWAVATRATNWSILDKATGDFTTIGQWFVDNLSESPTPPPPNGDGMPQPQPNLIPLVILALLGLVGVATFGGD